jgi:hypothetical protein
MMRVCLLIIWKDRIPFSPWIPPVSGRHEGKIFRVLIDKLSITIIVIEIFLKRLFFPIHIGMIDHATFKHSFKKLESNTI